MQGPALNIKFAGYDVRPATEADIAACNLLCHQVHGFERGVELREAISARTAKMSIGLYNEPAGAWLPSILL
jgi:hypothetical protein